MSDNFFSKQILWSMVKISIILALFAPLVFATNFYFPYIVPRNLFFRFFVDVAFFAYLFLLITYPEFRPRFNKAFSIFLIFILSLAFSSILNGSFSFSFWSNFERMDGLVNWLYLAMYSFVLVGFLQNERTNLLQVFRIALVPAFLVALIAVGQKLNLDFVLASSGGDRIAATFGNAAYVGSYMFLHILVAFYLLVKERARRYWSLAYVASILLFVWTLMATDTRGAFLGLLVFIFLFCIFYLFLQKQQKNKIYFTVLGLSILSVVFVALLFIQKEATWVKAVPILRKISGISFSETTTQSRLLIWRNSWQGVVDKPIFGWGEENFSVVFNQYFPIEIFHDIGSETWFDRPHNILVQHLIHGGFVGLILYLSIFVYLIFILAKHYKKHHDWFMFSFWSAFLLSFLFHDLFIFDSLNTNVILYLLLAYLFSLKDDTRHYFFDKFFTKLKTIFSFKDRQIILNFRWLCFVGFLVFGHFFVYQPLVANKNLIKSLQAFANIQAQSDLDNVLNFWQKSYDASTLGDKEKVQNLQQMTSQIAQIEGIDARYKAKFIQETQKYFENLLNKYPQDVRFALFASGFYYDFAPFDASFVTKNLDLLNKAQVLAPNKPEFYFSLSNAYLTAGDFEAAQQVAKKLSELAPWAKSVHWNLFKISAVSGDEVTVTSSLNIIKNINQEQSQVDFTEQELNQLNYFMEYAKEADPKIFQVLSTYLENYKNISA